MRKIFIYISIITLLTGCDRFFEFGGEEVLDDYDLGIEPKLVVEAMITEQDTIQAIRLSTTRSMYDKDQNLLVKNALVQVIGGGELYDYEYIDSVGLYLAQFKGMPQIEYVLEIDWNGKNYTARETMADLQHFEIDSIEIKKAVFDITHWRYFDMDTPFRSYRDKEILITVNPDYTIEDTLIGGVAFQHHVVYANPDNTSEVLETYKYGDLAEFWFGGDPYIIDAAREDRLMNVYKVYLHASESQIESNYYRFDIKRKGKSWLHPGQLIIANDFALRENISGIEFPGYFVEGDEVEFIMYGISRKAYNFYLSLQSVLQNDGGNFSSIPGNPQTNVFDEEGVPALGYFEVNKVATVKKVILAD